MSGVGGVDKNANFYQGKIYQKVSIHGRLYKFSDVEIYRNSENRDERHVHQPV